MNSSKQTYWLERFIIYVEAHVNKVLPNPTDRVIIKLHLENYPIEEIARLYGLSTGEVNRILARCAPIVAETFGWPFETLHETCSQANTVLRNAA